MLIISKTRLTSSQLLTLITEYILDAVVCQ
uniref:Uncharacterized protein n=1 Tax=Parascaris univalens TaxID=6257 RepID=A0A915A3H4_PARUN